MLCNILFTLKCSRSSWLAVAVPSHSAWLTLAEVLLSASEGWLTPWNDCKMLGNWLTWMPLQGHPSSGLVNVNWNPWPLGMGPSMQRRFYSAKTKRSHMHVTFWIQCRCGVTWWKLNMGWAISWSPLWHKGLLPEQSPGGWFSTVTNWS